MIEPAVLGWFCMLALREWLRGSDEHPAPATARAPVPMWGGVPIGCHWEHPGRHMQHYVEGAEHLCNTQCVHQPPEER